MMNAKRWQKHKCFFMLEKLKWSNKSSDINWEVVQVMNEDC